MQHSAESNAELSSAEIKRQLSTPVAELHGVGPAQVEQLARLSLFRVQDLLFNFPRDYQDLSDERPIADLEEGLLLTVRVVVNEVRSTNTRFGKSRVAILVSDGTGHLRATWFNQPFMQSKFYEGQHLLLTAKPRMRGLMWEMSHPQITWLSEEETEAEGQKLLPVYSLTEGLSQYQLRRIQKQAVEQYHDVPEEVFPPQLLKQYNLLPIADAIRGIHSPESEEHLAAARRRFVFQELFVLQLALTMRRSQQQQAIAPELPATAKIDARIRRLLPFELTESQNQTIREIANDMALRRPMNRLLQGDVGSGKTIVALYAMLVTVAHGKQAVLMAPTEILARQHADTLARLLEASRVRYATLTGGTSKAEREKILAEIAAGEIDVVLGTHAVIQDKVQFPNLGLLVIDEQHKFGVRQRAVLRKEERVPHYLVMTATPIPRTMTMTMFGDLDISTLRESPQGRQPVSTYLVEPDEQEKWWQFVRDRLRLGRQAYVVAPLIEQSENISAPSVAAAFEQLTNGELEAFRTGLLHGRMTPAEKQQAMEEFRQGKTQVLVSTSVIEVGVDVPNASVITIVGPERFGLAQLHQLRGRVGRGSHPGFCGLLLEGSKEEMNTERLDAFAASTDGFELAELDFKLRGPGDLFGTQQHGMPPLRIADLNRDQEILAEARREAQLLIGTDPELEHANHGKLRTQMLKRYSAALELGDVG